jgi:glutaredoxin
MATVTVFGADWCPLTKAALLHLDQVGVEYQYVDIDHDAAAAKWVAEQNNGKEKKPTILVEGQILCEPTDRELEDVLRAKRVLT